MGSDGRGANRLPAPRLRWRVPAPSRSRVTVVVPCYNYGRYLAQAVESVLAQDDVESSVIIVDDASSDGSQEVARSLAERFENVIAVLHEQNMGHLATYNDGLHRADSDYVLLLSADDLLAPGALARAVAIMERHPTVGLVYGFAPSFTDEPPRPRRRQPRYLVWSGDAWISQVCRRGQNPVCTPSAVMRRETFAGSGGYDARLPHAADLLMWLRAASLSDVAYISGVDQAFYRVHESNMHSTTFADLESDVQQRRDAFGIFFDESADHGSADLRLQVATRALAREVDTARRLGSQQDRSATLALGSAWRMVEARLGWRVWREVGVRI